MNSGQSKRWTASAAVCLFSFALAVIAVMAYNYSMLGQNLEHAKSSDKRNAGVNASTHFLNYVNPSVVVFNIDGMSPTNSRADLFRLFLQFAESEKNRRFSAVQLSCQNKPRFAMAGSYFSELGKGYATENPIYTMRTLPSHLQALDGRAQFTDTGDGLSGMIKQISQFSTFVDRWCVTTLSS